jgi:hypothetical protein
MSTAPAVAAVPTIGVAFVAGKDVAVGSAPAGEVGAAVGASAVAWQ